jgi:hypothetical protein
MYTYSSDPNVRYPNKRAVEDNPMGQFAQSTYAPQLNSFQAAYQSHDPLIEKTNFKNQNNVLHNNLRSNLQNEFITEYTIDIDSKDRDISVYPNPFKYTVAFAPVTKGTTMREEWIDPANKSLGKHMVTVSYIGTPAPYISRTFRNIKYIRVDNITLPRYDGIVDNGSGTWIMDTTHDLAMDRFVVLRVTNLTSNYNISTNSDVDTVGIKMIPDTLVLNSKFYYTVPANSTNLIKLYNYSALGNLDRLQFEFVDSMGNLLSYTGLDPTKTDVRNPLNVNLQNNVTIVFGVVENELATETKFFK